MALTGERVTTPADHHDLQQTVLTLTERIAGMEARLAEAGVAPDPGFSDDKLATIARSVYRTRQRRRRLFDPALFGDPAWDMLLDLFIAKVRGARVATTSLCLAAHVPQATGIRWIRLLEERDLVRRYSAPDDARLSLIEITQKAYHLMRQSMAEAVTRFDWPGAD